MIDGVMNVTGNVHSRSGVRIFRQPYALRVQRLCLNIWEDIRENFKSIVHP
jgi:hypothetical protein